MTELCLPFSVQFSLRRLSGRAGKNVPPWADPWSDNSEIWICYSWDIVVFMMILSWFLDAYNCDSLTHEFWSVSATMWAAHCFSNSTYRVRIVNNPGTYGSAHNIFWINSELISELHMVQICEHQSARSSLQLKAFGGNLRGSREISKWPFPADIGFIRLCQDQSTNRICGWNQSTMISGISGLHKMSILTFFDHIHIQDRSGQQTHVPRRLDFFIGS